MDKGQVVERAREIMQPDKAYVMATVDGQGKPQMRWMGALARDPQDEKVYYIVSAANARKVEQIAGNPATQLLFTNEGYSCMLTVEGTCELVADAAVKDMVWEAIPGMTAYFGGKDDPNYGVLRFQAKALELLCMGEEMQTDRVELE